MSRNPARSAALLVLLALLILLPISYSLSAVFPPGGKPKLSVSVRASLVENSIVLILKHAGGDCVNFSVGTLKERAGGRIRLPDGREVKVTGWTFERPDRFCEGDLAWAKVDLSGQTYPENFEVFAELWIAGAGTVFRGTVTVK